VERFGKNAQSLDTLGQSIVKPATTTTLGLEHFYAAFDLGGRETCRLLLLEPYDWSKVHAEDCCPNGCCHPISVAATCVWGFVLFLSRAERPSSQLNSGVKDAMAISTK